MNNARRKEISETISVIENTKDLIEMILETEQDYYDNCPENLQAGERYQQSENAISELENCISSLEDAISNLEEARQ
ncbi:MAG: hypothetical protein ACYDEX_19150 [Mobilitalea sp.]